MIRSLGDDLAKVGIRVVPFNILGYGQGGNTPLIREERPGPTALRLGTSALAVPIGERPEPVVESQLNDLASHRYMPCFLAGGCFPL